MTSLDPTAGDDSAFAEREFRYTRRDFRRIAELLYEEAGIALTDAKAPLVYARLVKRLRALGLESFARYCALLDSEEGRLEREQMTAALTTNVTRFFREPHHFDHLKREVLPAALSQARRGARIRIWSAGCSSGEEPYSIALSILALAPDAAQFDVRVLATDINAEVLARGARGVYTDAAVAPVDRRLRADWFQRIRGPEGLSAWRVGPELSTLVSFRELNLMRPWPMRAAYQAVFCRNVLIYFGQEERIDVWRRISEVMSPDGRLYVGHAERVHGVGELFALEGTTTYRRLGEASS